MITDEQTRKDFVYIIEEEREIQVVEDANAERKESTESVREVKKAGESQIVKVPEGEDEFEDNVEENDADEPEEQKVVDKSPSGRFQRFTEMIGRGAYKRVYRGVDMDTGREVAWSIIDLNQLHKTDK